MSLLSFLKSLDSAARGGFASRCGTTVDYLFQIAYGNRVPKVQLAVAIDRESAGKVRCDDLLPEVDWGYLRAGNAGTTETVANT